MPEVYTKDGPVWREIEMFDPDTAALPEPAVWWKRLLLIRHVRWLRHSWRAERHYGAWAAMDALPAYRAFDDRCLDAIWRGDL